MNNLLFQKNLLLPVITTKGLNYYWPMGLAHCMRIEVSFVYHIVHLEIIHATKFYLVESNRRSDRKNTYTGVNSFK